jgi:putative two-component system response regulator
MEQKPLHHILLVDDHRANIDLLYEILHDDYEVSVAMDGKSAVRFTVEEVPDLLLLDVMMPGMDGYEVCRQLKDNLITKHIPIIFITAAGDAENETRGFEVGAVDFIAKPINPLIVKARVRTHLALFDQNRALETKIRQRTKELEETRLEIIRELGRAAEFKDYNTGMHVLRVSYSCKWIAQYAGLSEDYVTMIYQASPMHDVGKIGVPDHILKKPGVLTDEEWHVMKQHVEIGADIVGEHESDLLKLVREIVMTHHERWDGSGYPNGLIGEEIPLSGRIAAIADVFDALTDKRPYKDAWPINEAVSFIAENSAALFDPQMVEAFEKALPDILPYYKKE